MNSPGLYVILCGRAGSGGESDVLGYALIDVGESEAVRDRVEDHDRTDCWKRHCSGDIQYAAHYTPELRQSGRRQIVRDIRDEYGVRCG